MQATSLVRLGNLPNLLDVTECGPWRTRRVAQTPGLSATAVANGSQTKTWSASTATPTTLYVSPAWNGSAAAPGRSPAGCTPSGRYQPACEPGSKAPDRRPYHPGPASPRRSGERPVSPPGQPEPGNHRHNRRPGPRPGARLYSHAAHRAQTPSAGCAWKRT